MSFIQLPPNPKVLLKSTQSPEKTPPSWLSEVVLHGKLWKINKLFDEAIEKVKVKRGRAGDYEPIDFLSITLGYIISNESAQSKFYEELQGFESILSGMWERKKVASQSALCNFYQDIDSNALESLRGVLFKSFLEHGVSREFIGGLFDRGGQRHIVFDVDGQKHGMRLRSLITSEGYPEPIRRVESLAKPGYGGRKRGEVFRTRSALQQAHTQEWLGTFGSSGNGKPVEDLERAGQLVIEYLKANEVDLSESLIRLDGLYGTPSTISVLHRLKLGYIVRATTYKLLKLGNIPEEIKKLPHMKLRLPDSNVERELYDLGFLEWKVDNKKVEPFQARFILSRRILASGETHRVGKKIGKYVYELFATNKSAEAFLAKDIVEIYFGRGGFEDTFRWEDIEMEPDRWYSKNPFAQEWCQLLAQWVWNARLLLGFTATETPLERVIWSERFNEHKDYIMPNQEEEKEEDKTTAEEHTSIEDLPKVDLPSQEQISPEMEYPLARHELFQPADYELISPTELRCPAGHTMKISSIENQRSGKKALRFIGKAENCEPCIERWKCQKPDAKRPKQVNVPIVDGHPVQPTYRAPASLLHGFRKGESLEQAALEGKEKQDESFTIDPPHSLPASLLPLIYLTYPAVFLRRFIPSLLSSLYLEIRKKPRENNVQPIPLNEVKLKGGTMRSIVTRSRAQRARRRLSYEERFRRNALPHDAPVVEVIIHGLPVPVAKYLNISNENEGFT